MTVLVVDDQVSVVSALISGIEWKKIGISAVLKAYNAFEAKEILRTRPVDIMLCDIEMPAEDGLELFRWSKEHSYRLECIFLTSHADFYYAKEALQLGSFDYILQPARYEDVQAALQRVIAKVDNKREYETYYSYGRLLRNERGILQDSVLGRFLHTGNTDNKGLEEALLQLNTGLTSKRRFCLALLQIIGPPDSHEEESENDELFRYGITNILCELSDDYGQRALLLKYDGDCYAFILYSEGEPLNEESFAGLLQRFIDVCVRYYHCRIAAYVAGITDFLELPVQIKALTELRDDNVIHASRIFYTWEKAQKEHGLVFSFNQRRWSTLAQQGDFRAAEVEIDDCLNLMESSSAINAEQLQNFYQDFVQLVFNVLSDMGLGMSDVLPIPAQRELFMSAPRSVGEMREILRIVSGAIEKAAGSSRDEEGQVETMVRYIHENIEKDIRRSDLAATVFLSPDYVSHLFRQKMNMSLSDFVISEKMRVARSLLRTSRLPISVIAVKVGYSNFSHFSKTYKRIYGISPAGERKTGE